MITPAFALLFACLFGFMWTRDRTRLHILGVSLGYAGLVVSFVLAVTLFDPNSVVIAAFINIVATGGAASMVWGIARRLGQRSPLAAYCAVIACSSIAIALAVWARAPMAIMLAQNGGSALVFAIGAVTAWHSGSRQGLDRVMVWLLSLLSLHGFTRPLQAMLIEGLPATIGFDAAALQAINVVALCLFSAGLGMVFFASLARDQIDEEREAGRLDPLSGLSSRAVFEAAARDKLDRAGEQDAEVSLIMADIDHFKRVNDTWGHAAGDRVIAAFGQLIAARIRSADEAGRVGGEEFCLLVWNCPEAAAIGLADRLRLALPDQSRREGDVVASCTASFGVAQWHPGESYTNLFKRADSQLYNAKRAGRDRVYPKLHGQYEDEDNIVAISA
ncbi:MAG: GGDEF domain-containing protein [Pseudomonadota bacterium]